MPSHHTVCGPASRGPSASVATRRPATSYTATRTSVCAGSWKRIRHGNPERSEDAQGDLFLSTVAKFKINKPGSDWFFDVGATNPALRIRIRHKDKQLTSQIVMGVELRNYPLAESMKAIESKVEH